jgi:hypothetical protein
MDSSFLTILLVLALAFASGTNEGNVHDNEYVYNAASSPEGPAEQ